MHYPADNKSGCSRHRDDDFRDLPLLDKDRDAGQWSKHFQSMKASAYLQMIVVNKSNWYEPELSVSLEFSGCQCTSSSRAGDKYIFPGRNREVRLVDCEKNPKRQSPGPHAHDAQEPIHNRDGSRKSLRQDPGRIQDQIARPNLKEQSGNRDLDEQNKRIRAGIGPVFFIEPLTVKNPDL